MTAALRVAVTGVDGFVGRHVARALTSRGHRVIGLARSPIEDRRLRDILDEEVVADLTQGWPASVEADAVIHLAGLSAVGASFGSPQSYIETNSRMMTHMGEYLIDAGADATRVVVVSSGSVYASDSGVVRNEHSRTSASSPYAVSKLLIESQAEYYAARGLDMIVARPFNHIGPGQGPGFLLPDLARKIMEDQGEPLAVGDLSTRRDYTDVRDVARAYVDVVEAPRLEGRLLNICSGRSTSGHELLRLLARSLGVAEPETYIDPARRRPVDAADIVGDASELGRQVGWFPRISIADSVADFVNDTTGQGQD